MRFLRHIVHKWREIGVRGFIFRSLPPTRQGAFPKLTKRFLRFRPISRFRVHPLRGSAPPNWPLRIVGLGTLVKTNFVRGGSPPIWGRYGGLKFSTGVYFGPDFLETPSSDFGIFSPLDRGPPPLGSLKIWAKSDERNSRNVRPKAVPHRVVSCCRPTLRALFLFRSDCHRPDCPRSACPRSTPTTQSVKECPSSYSDSVLVFLTHWLFLPSLNIYSGLYLKTPSSDFHEILATCRGH